jgi:hypothetical protein
MKKLKVQKALFGKLFKGSGSTSSSGGFGSLLSDLFAKALKGDTTSTWSKEKMAGLSKYAPGSYGTGQQTAQQTAKASKGKFIVGKGSDYIKDLL